MDRYVGFVPRDGSDIGAWYRLLEPPELATGAGIRAELVLCEEPYPGMEYYETSIVREAEECASYTRTEYDEDEVPDHVWAKIAERVLLND